MNKNGGIFTWILFASIGFALGIYITFKYLLKWI